MAKGQEIGPMTTKSQTKPPTTYYPTFTHILFLMRHRKDFYEENEKSWKQSLDCWCCCVNASGSEAKDVCKLFTYY